MITEEKIRFAARELNTIVSPQVDVEGDIEIIKEWIQKVLGAVPPVLEPTDVFKPTTMEVITYFQTPDHEKEEPEEETVEEAPPSDSLIDQIRSSKKLRDLKDIVNVNEELKSMRGTLGKYQEIESLRDKMIEVLTAITSTGEVIEEEPIKITIKQNFKNACPKLSEKEYEDLEKLIVKDGKILQPLLTWNGILVDGHNRYAIALKHNIPFTIQEMRFNNENEVLVWIKENAISQRNLTDFAKYELIKDIEEVLKVKAKERQRNAGKGIKTDEPKMTVREEMAEKIDVSPSQLRKMKEFDEKAPVELKEEVRKGKVKLGTALKEIKPKEEPTDNAKIKTAARELEKWVIKYTDESLLTSYVNEVTDIAIRIKESL